MTLLIFSALPFPPEALVVHAEGRLVTAPDGIDLVSALGAVEVDLSVRLAVPITDGQSVRIPVLPHQGQDAAGFLFQQLHARLLGQLLLPSSHCWEHIFLLSRKKSGVAHNPPRRSNFD